MKSKCSKRHVKEKLNDIEMTRISYVKFTLKGPKAGKGPAADEVHFEQREPLSVCFS